MINRQWFRPDACDLAFIAYTGFYISNIMWFYSKLEKKVKRLMGERGDYKGWYYLPYHDMAAATGAEMTDDRTSMGRKG